MIQSNRISGMFGDVIGAATKVTATRQALVSDLHYEVKRISDSDLAYVVEMVKSLGAKNQGPRVTKGLLGQTRVIITGEQTADVAVVWSHDGESILASSYSRMSNGGWKAHDGREIDPEWLTDLEGRYQTKRREVELAARSEGVR